MRTFVAERGKRQRLSRKCNLWHVGSIVLGPAIDVMDVSVAALIAFSITIIAARAMVKSRL